MQSFKFTLGMLLLLTNFVVGWGGIILCAWLARKTGRKRYYSSLGTGTYFLSWGMAFAGALLAGSEGILIIENVAAPYRLSALLVVLMIILPVWLWIRKGKNSETSGIERSETEEEA